MMDRDFYRRVNAYQSANLTDEESIAQFVVRKKEFDRIIEEVRRDDMSGSIQHYILVGRRGSGKSTLLRRIVAEINTVEELNKKLLVVYLSEEQAGIYKLHDLWDIVLRELKAKQVESKMVEWSAQESPSEYSRSLYLSLQEALKKEEKKLVLLLDNIDRIFDNIGDDAHTLRELLTNHKDLRIIGSSTTMDEHYWDYDQAFYQFFRIIRLDSLISSEIKDWLIYWSQGLDMPGIMNFVEDNPGKIEAIRILTDGMPRTLLHFLEILIDRPTQNGFEYLKYIMDRVTPIYQERLNRLPASQRKILLELSFFGEAARIKQLISSCKMEGKIISAQLNQLVNNRVVEKISYGKDNLYRLSERFFNLWLILTQGSPEVRKEVKYMTGFLESWYSEKEFKQISSEHPDRLHLKESKSNDYAVYLTPALAYMYYKQNINKKKALDLSGKYVRDKTGFEGLVLFCTIALWAGEMLEFESKIDGLVSELVKQENIDQLAFLFTQLLIHKQYNLVWDWFNLRNDESKALQKMIKPIYFVAAGFIHEEKTKEVMLKPGKELTDTIQEIRDAIIERQKFYYQS
jgi:hypothetical protein